MTGTPLVSVVVPTRNRATFLAGLLAALENQSYAPHEIVVVDDASEDNTRQILRRWAGEGRIALRLDRPSGSYAARNRGWRAARGEVVAFTDDDCLPQPGWLAGLVAALGNAGALGAQGVTLARPGEITPFTHQIEQTEPGPPYRTCNIAYRRAVLERMGGFDDSLRWYADNILGLQVRELGPIAFAPDAIVFHPPRPRDWRDRATWKARFAADQAHRVVLRRLAGEPAVPRRALPVILWVLRPIVRQTGAHLRYLARHPVDYLHQVRPMLWEKRELVVALGEYVLPSRMARGQGRRGGHSRKLVPTEAGPTEPGSSTSVAAGPRCLPSLPEQPLVSILVVTRDRPASLAETLAALDHQTWRRREVIVVEHAPAPSPSDGAGSAVAMIAEAYGARVVTSRQSTLGGARQDGVCAARGEIVAFTDDDCLPDPRWLETMVEALRGDPTVWGVQGRTESGKGPIGSHSVHVQRAGSLYQTCNMAYRREAIEEAGGFDPGFVGWFEDTALGARVLERGGTIGFEPAAVVVHRAMPRKQRDRQTWRAILRDERRLEQTHRQFYRRTRQPIGLNLGAGWVSAVAVRWLVGSPLKEALRALPNAVREPAAYLRLLAMLMRERVALAQALADVLRGT